MTEPCFVTVGAVRLNLAAVTHTLPSLEGGLHVFVQGRLAPAVTLTGQDAERLRQLLDGLAADADPFGEVTVYAPTARGECEG